MKPTRAPHVPMVLLLVLLVAVTTTTTTTMAFVAHVGPVGRLSATTTTTTATTTTKRTSTATTTTWLSVLSDAHKYVVEQPESTPPQTTTTTTTTTTSTLSPWGSTIRKITLLSYIASMCVLLPLCLTPVWFVQQFNLVERPRREALALDVGQGVARALLKIMPFCTLTVQSDACNETAPSIWVCNHTSMLDTFILLIADRDIRGPQKRPIKTVYWKGLENNPIINMLFQLCGFIPVDMADNGSGNPNEYNKASFKTLLRQVKTAFHEGFDILILPEGQLNPWPEQGLLPVFGGAHKLSVTSRRPIHMFAFYGCQHMWRANNNDDTNGGQDDGINVQSAHIQVRGYSQARIFDSEEEFMQTFRAVVGHFGATGQDVPELALWLDGSVFQKANDVSNDNTTPTQMVDPRAVDCSDIEQAIATALECERPNHNYLDASVEQSQEKMDASSG